MVEIEEILIYQVRIPFTGDFAHFRTAGTESANVVVEVRADHGKVAGYGEAGPRAFVTGETQESVTKSLIRFLDMRAFPWRLEDDGQIRAFIGSLPEEREVLSAICAIETALLDALGKDQRRTLRSYFPQDHAASEVIYGASVPLTNRRRIAELCRMILRLDIRRVKLKMGRDLSQNRDAFEALSEVFGDQCDLKIDVNGAWDYRLASEHLPLLLEHRVRAVEEPLSPEDRDIARLAELYRANGILLMADESACSIGDIERLLRQGCYGIVNVRLSKCGGFNRSLRGIDMLRGSGIPFQIGAQLGESGILSSAGRALSLLCSDAVYHDGCYDRFLLKTNITTEHVSFGPGGVARPLPGSGLGVQVDRENLRQLTTRIDRVPYH